MWVVNFIYLGFSIKELSFKMQLQSNSHSLFNYMVAMIFEWLIYLLKHWSLFNPPIISGLWTEVSLIKIIHFINAVLNVKDAKTFMFVLNVPVDTP